MSMFSGFTDGVSITEENLNVGEGSKFNFQPATNAIMRLIDIDTKMINESFGGIEYTLEMIQNDEGVDVGEQKQHLFKTVQTDEKSQRIENGYWKASVASMGFQGTLEDKSQIIGKMFMADISIFKAASGKEYQNMRNFRRVDSAPTVQSTTQPAQQGFATPNPQQGFNQPQTGFNQQPAFTQK